MRRLAFIALLGLAACITPSIPIPPPDPAQADFTITVQDNGTSTASFSYPPDNNYVGAGTVSRCIVLRPGLQDPNTYCSF